MTQHREETMDDNAMSPNSMDRRDAVRLVTAMLGGIVLVGDAALVHAQVQPPRPRTAPRSPIGTFTVEDQALLDEIADTILPTTAKSPGAKAAHTGPFMALMVTDTYTADNQAIFRSGMSTLNDACKSAHQVDFMRATPKQRTALLTRLDAEQHAYMKTRKSGEPTHYFRMMKELALLGFFTSEIGCTKAQRYREAPGPYQACVPYKKGETSWAGHA
ncbi:MAG: hypothetical protein RLZZ621_1359 [Gemmatimonadota bacterium]|jgi:hypothetical protein